MAKTKGKKKPPKPKESTGQQVADAEVIPHRNLYVANLAGMDMTDEKLKELFEACGEITSVNVVNTANHTFGFVEFATIAEAECALEKMNGHLGMAVKFARNTSAPAVTPPITSKHGKEEDEEEEASEGDDANEQETEAADTAPTTEHATPVIARSTARAAAARDYPNPVESLNALVQQATRATSTRDHITYTIEDADDGTFVSTVEVQVPGGNSSQSGEPRESKREAKASAAKAALRDPDVHVLLPPLPAKVREPKLAKATPSVSVEEDLDEIMKAVGLEDEPETSGTVISSKKQRQLEKAELRAKKIAGRKAAKAAKAALAEERDEEEEEEEEEDDESEEETADSSEDSEDVDEESTVDTSDDEEDTNATELAAKKAAIKAALAAKRKAAKHGNQRAAAAAGKESGRSESSKKSADKAAFNDDSIKFKDTRLQANYGQTKFIKP